MELVNRIETSDYVIAHYQGDPARVIVVFSSAGRDGAGEPVEEFRKTLASFGVSIIFVMDRQALWYNHESTPEAFSLVQKLVSEYANAGCIGESMGGSGSILFSNYCKNISRVLSFVPQFSICSPFIAFDNRYANIEKRFKKRLFIDYADTPIMAECQLVYGNTEWRDAIHQGMFRASGFPITLIDGADHLVARHLKTSKNQNYLLPLVEKFCDFSITFSQRLVSQLTKPFQTSLAIKPKFGFRDEKEFEESWSSLVRTRPKHQLATPAGENLSRFKPSTQSSISKWSLGKTLEADAQGGNDDNISKPFGFHTALEQSPWWAVDLGQKCRIHEARLYNRLDHVMIAKRASKFSLQIAMQSDEWTTVFTRDDPMPFGGADGRPFIWLPEIPIEARYFRVCLVDKTYLHLAQVEVYGEYVGISEGRG